MDILWTLILKYLKWVPIIVLVGFLTYGITSGYNDKFDVRDIPKTATKELLIKVFKNFNEKGRSLQSLPEIFNSVTSAELNFKVLEQDLNSHYFWKYSAINVDLSYNVSDMESFIAKYKNDSVFYNSISDSKIYDIELLHFPDRLYDQVGHLMLVASMDSLMTQYEIKSPDVGNWIFLIDFAKIIAGGEILKLYNQNFINLEFTALKEIRYENILIATVGALLLSLLISQIPKIAGTESKKANEDTLTQLSDELPKLVYYDLKISEDKTHELYSRSSLMLISGIAMSIVGIIVFSVYVPDPDDFSGENELRNYSMNAVRPTLMLIFIESIAFFLLRQYRVLIEDFKYFHKLFLKRLNYAESYQILTDPKYKDQKDLVNSLLGEKLDGKLSNGETTENLEGIKQAVDDDPTKAVKELMEALKEKGLI